MPRKGEYSRSDREIEIPAVPPRIGPREVTVRSRSGAVNTSRLEVREFVCARLAAELADEWLPDSTE